MTAIAKHIWPSGHMVEVVRTCCSWEHPDRRGPHGMHIGGHRPYWLRIDGGEWSNVRSPHNHWQIVEDTKLFEATTGPADWLRGCGWVLR